MSETNEWRDRILLRQLVDRYGVCADTRDRPGFRANFTEDATLSLPAGRTFRGGDAIAGVVSHLEDRYEKTMHFVGNHLVHFHGDRVTGLTYCLAHHLYVADGVQRDTVMLIRYSDVYERSADSWQFTSRTLDIDWQEDRPTHQ